MYLPLSISLNRAVPKFMKRIKVPDYKDRNVFGVPLTVNVQRTGQPLPQSIQQAMRYLRNHCLDQVRVPLSHGNSDACCFLQFYRENVYSILTLSVFLLTGWALQKIRRQIPDPGSAPYEWKCHRLCQLWRAVCLWCGRHAEAVLPRPSWAINDKQTLRNLSPDLPV